MLDVFTSILPSTGITLTSFLLCFAAAFACGVITMFAAGFRANLSKGFKTSLVILPAVVATVIMMVNGNVGTGIAVAGAFALVRFRSVPGKAKDIVSIFLAMTAGLACAAGYVGIALLFTVITAGVLFLLAWLPLSGAKEQELRITIPESLHYADEFNDLFEEYTKKHRLVTVKTANMGSLYKLLYAIELKDETKTQEFIDKLRCRNGNLEIAVSEGAERSDEL